ncbi:MAG: hypothetical protein ACTSUE_06485 [Promethearchaeota archaeon]
MEHDDTFHKKRGKEIMDRAEAVSARLVRPEEVYFSGVLSEFAQSDWGIVISLDDDIIQVDVKRVYEDGLAYHPIGTPSTLIGQTLNNYYGIMDLIKKFDIKIRTLQAKIAQGYYIDMSGAVNSNFETIQPKYNYRFRFVNAVESIRPEINSELMRIQDIEDNISMKDYLNRIRDTPNRIGQVHSDQRKAFLSFAESWLPAAFERRKFHIRYLLDVVKQQVYVYSVLIRRSATTIAEAKEQYIILRQFELLKEQNYEKRSEDIWRNRFTLMTQWHREAIVYGGEGGEMGFGNIPIEVMERIIAFSGRDTTMRKYAQDTASLGLAILIKAMTGVLIHPAMVNDLAHDWMSMSMSALDLIRNEEDEEERVRIFNVIRRPMERVSLFIQEAKNRLTNQFLHGDLRHAIHYIYTVNVDKGATGDSITPLTFGSFTPLNSNNLGVIKIIQKSMTKADAKAFSARMVGRTYKFIATAAVRVNEDIVEMLSLLPSEDEKMKGISSRHIPSPLAPHIADQLYKARMNTKKIKDTPTVVVDVGVDINNVDDVGVDINNVDNVGVDNSGGGVDDIGDSVHPLTKKVSVLYF